MLNSWTSCMVLSSHHNPDFTLPVELISTSRMTLLTKTGRKWFISSCPVSFVSTQWVDLDDRSDKCQCCFEYGEAGLTFLAEFTSSVSQFSHLMISTKKSNNNKKKILKFSSFYGIYILKLKIGAQCSQFKSIQTHTPALKNYLSLRSPKFNSLGLVWPKLCNRHSSQIYTGSKNILVPTKKPKEHMLLETRNSWKLLLNTEKQIYQVKKSFHHKDVCTLGEKDSAAGFCL